MRSFKARGLIGVLAVISAMALLTNCEGQPPEDGTEVMHTALSGGSSTRADLDFAQMKVFGSGEIEGECMTYEVDARVIERTTFGAEAVERDYVWVRIRRFCCDDDNIFTTWTGALYLNPDDYELNMPTNRQSTWSAQVTQTVTVRNQGDRSQTMSVTLNLNWLGLDNFHNRTDTEHLEGQLVSHYNQRWCPADITGSISLAGQPDAENVEFDWSTKQSVRMISRSQTTHSR